MLFFKAEKKNEGRVDEYFLPTDNHSRSGPFRLDPPTREGKQLQETDTDFDEFDLQSIALNDTPSLEVISPLSSPLCLTQ